MGLLDKYKVRDAAARLIEEQAYAQAVREVESGKRRDGLWGKALASAGGDVDAARAKYIELRVQSLIDEARVSQSIDDAISQSTDKEKQQRIREQNRAEKARKREERDWEIARQREADRQDFFPSIFWFLCSLFFGLFSFAVFDGAIKEGIQATQFTSEQEIWLLLIVPPIGFFFALWMGFKARRLESERKR